MEKHNEEIQKLVDKGYVEIIPHEEIDSRPGKTWYMPHREHLDAKKPDKWRIVHDASRPYEGKSLNDRVHRGPDLMNRLLHVFLRFREHEYAWQGDIQDMYHRVLVPPHDRDALRFLWYDASGNVAHLRFRVHIFGGIWCSAAANYCLRRVIDDSPVASPDTEDRPSRSSIATFT